MMIGSAAAAIVHKADQKRDGERHPELAENLSENKFYGSEGKRKEDRTVDKRADQAAYHNSPSRITLSHRRVDHKVGKLGKEESHDRGDHK